MQLTNYTDYSLRVLIFLSIHSDRKVTIKEISSTYKISKNHLVKVVHKLSTLGYLNTTSGVKGGITLAMTPNKINLADIIKKIEPSFHIVECFNPQGDCVIHPVCELKSILNKALQAFLKSIDQYTLADISKKQSAYRKFLTI
ncbi:MAG TPA: Rrf2 family transcriptional regulator [Leptospiraceae bacterium]|nr:Rrf2 family transcriptional regulator [Leptospiraceae bacterium]HMW05132.1 Rrf2 family transcriptional regulator [Leptospiraceae bacterium]HMX31386.1 Rrf2 family transcriptional regulator [Leptospiraceae bacterium]HMY31571.1 Rrf2 family transcriptional regulator [Leptospiraceae bacterium]HMZ66689.1 Rrf2 family transcriptional regulator [Leptospiraceae bacterium]